MVQKSPEAFRTISEVATTLDLPAHVLRFWESRFSQIKPIKRGGGRRYYRPQDINLLRGIRELLHSEGESIKGVQKILREHGVRHVVALGAGEAANTAEAPATAPKPERKPVAALVPDPEPGSGPKARPAPAAPIQAPPAAAPAARTSHSSAPTLPRDNVQRDLFDDFQPAPDPTPAARRVPENKKREIRVLRDRLVTLRDAMKGQD